MTGVFSNKTLQFASVFVLVILAVLFLIQTHGKAHREIGNDFTSYLLSANALAHGENPYATDSVFQYVYPLFLALALIPLTVLPYSLSVIVWYFVAVGALGWSVRILIDSRTGRLDAPGGAHLLVPLCAATILLFPVVQTNLLNGQVNFLVLLLCTLFLKWHSENRTWPAAAMLAMAMAIKIFPAILLFFLLFQKRFKELFLSVALAIGMSLLPAVLLGREGIHVVSEYLQSVLPGLHAEVSACGEGRIVFSLAGLISQAVSGAGGTPWLQLVSAVAAVTGLWILHNRLRPWSRAQATPSLSAIYLLAMLLIAPLSETHHLAFLIPAAIFIILESMRAPNKRLISRILAPAALVGFFWLGELLDSGFFVFITVIGSIVILVWMAATSRTRIA